MFTEQIMSKHRICGVKEERLNGIVDIKRAERRDGSLDLTRKSLLLRESAWKLRGARG